MNTVIEIYVAGNWVDITGVVESIGKAPYTGRNRDYTARLGRISLKIAITIRDLLDDETFNPSEDTPIRISHDSTFIYGGYIVKNLYNFADMSFSVEIQNNLGALQGVIVDYDTLHTAFATGTNWYEYQIDWVGNKIVGVLWAMKKMFEAANLTLDVSGVQNEVVVTYSGETYIRNCSIDFKDFFFYENKLWCAGQSICADHTVIDNTDHDYNRYKQNAFDIVSEVCSSLMLTLKQTAINSFTLVYTPDESYSVNDDDNFDYTQEKIKASTIDYADNLSWVTVTNSLSDYERTEAQYPTIKSDGITQSTRGRGTPVQTITNFMIYYSDAKVNTSPSGYLDNYNIIYCMGWITTDFINTVPDMQWGDDVVDYKHVNSIAMKVREAGANYTEEVILTNFESVSKNVVEHNIDLEWGNSEIIQEAYGE